MSSQRKCWQMAQKKDPRKNNERMLLLRRFSNAIRSTLVIWSTVLFSVPSCPTIMLWGIGTTMMFQPVEAHVYWAHVVDPPFFRPLTWWDASLPISNSDTLWSGGIWVPPSLDGKDDTYYANDTMFVSDFPPLCLTVDNKSEYCVIVETQQHLVAVSHGKRVNLTMVTIPGLASRNTIDNDMLIGDFVPDFPRCILHKLSSITQFGWKPCLGERPREQNLTVGRIIDWGPYGSFWDPSLNQSVLPFQKANHSIVWHNGGSAGPILQMEYNGSFSPPQPNVWRLALPFFTRQLSQVWIVNKTQANLSIIHEINVAVCTTHPYLFVMTSRVNITRCNHSFCIQLYSPSFRSCISKHDFNETAYIFPLRRRAELWIPVNLTRQWEGEDGLGRFVRILVEDIDKSKKRAKRFLGWLIFAIISAVIILASATAAIASLTQSVKTAHEVSEALTNVTKEFQIQEKVDEEVLSRLQALEATVMWLGDRQEALKTRISLPCDWEHIHKSLCVTPLPWNSSQHDWTFIKRHLMGAFDLSLQRNIQSLHDQLQDQIHRLQELTSQSVFDRLQQDLSWINPKNWFNGLNLRMWVFIGIGAGMFILFLVFLQVLRSAIRNVRKMEARIMVTLLTNGVVINKKGGDVEKNCGVGSFGQDKTGIRPVH